MAKKTTVRELIFSLMGKLAPSFSSAVGQASAGLDQVAEKTKKISAATQKRLETKALKDLNAAAAKTGKAFGNLRSEITGTMFAVTGTAMAAGAAVYGVAKTSANTADAAAKGAQGVGMTTEAFTQLRYAAGMSNVSQQDFMASTLKLSKTVKEALGGSQSAMEMFTRAGVELRDSEGNLKTTEQLYGELADTFAAMPDGIGKTNLAMDLFGRNVGAKMIPFLNGGAAALDDLREKAKRLGVSISETDAKNAEAFNDSISNMGTALQGVSLTIGKQLWPVLTDMHDQITDLIAQGNEWIQQELPGWIDELRERWPEIKAALLDLWGSAKEYLGKINDMAQSMGGWIPLIEKLVNGWAAYRALRIGVALGQTVTSVVKLGSAFSHALPALGRSSALFGTLGKVLMVLTGVFKMVAVGIAKAGAVLLANPIVLAAAGIAAAAYLIYKNWDTVLGWLKTAWKAWGEAADSAAGAISSAFSASWDAVAGVFAAGWNLLPDSWKAKLTGMADTAVAWGGQVLDAFGAVWDAVTGFFRDRAQRVRAAFSDGFLNGLLEAAKLFNPITIFQDAFSSLVDWLAEFDIASAGAALASRFGEAILSGLSSLKDSVVGAISDMIPGGSAVAGAAQSAASAVGNAAGWVGGKLAGLAGYADGGIITRPQLAMVGEDGPEVVIPTSKPDRARNLMQAAAGMMGMGGESGGGVPAMHITFAPVIHADGGGTTAEEIERILRQAEQRLRQIVMEVLERSPRDASRLRYGG